MISYELKEEVIDNETPTQYVEKKDGSGIKWQIPIDDNNSDYKEYLKWLEENE
jgi:hypothetical protein